MYTTLDLLEIKGLQDCVSSKQYPEKVDLESLLCNVYGNSFFEMLQENPRLFK